MLSLPRNKTRGENKLRIWVQEFVKVWIARFVKIIQFLHNKRQETKQEQRNDKKKNSKTVFWLRQKLWFRRGCLILDGIEFIIVHSFYFFKAYLYWFIGLPDFPGIASRWEACRFLGAGCAMGGQCVASPQLLWWGQPLIFMGDFTMKNVDSMWANYPQIALFQVSEIP